MMQQITISLPLRLEQLLPRLLPFADAATEALPLRRLLRLALFQVSVGMAAVLLIGTLNRVMIIELSVASGVVAVMVALPLCCAPLRALIGYRSDTHRSVLGWRRVPFIWMGTIMQFGGLAIMPFAILVLSGQGEGPVWVGHLGAALAFLLTGAGMHTVQTAGLALATDLAPGESRPRVIAFMYLLLLIGMLISGLSLGWLLANFTPVRLIQVVQGAAVLTMVLNLAALWKQEARGVDQLDKASNSDSFLRAWIALTDRGVVRRFLWAVALGTAGFGMQDIILEPYGAETLGMSVSATTMLTTTVVAGALCSLMLAARLLSGGTHAMRLAAYGVCSGIVAIACVVMSLPLDTSAVLYFGALLLGFGGGLFVVGTLTTAMSISAHTHEHGLVLGAWGAAQATALGLAVAGGGLLRDAVAALAIRGHLGEALNDVTAGYLAVYHVEILLLFIALIVIGPMASNPGNHST